MGRWIFVLWGRRICIYRLSTFGCLVYNLWILKFYIRPLFANLVGKNSDSLRRLFRATGFYASFGVCRQHELGAVVGVSAPRSEYRTTQSLGNLAIDGRLQRCLSV